MALHAKRTPKAERRKVKSSEALLVCGYEEDEQLRKLREESGVSYEAFRKKIASMPRGGKIAFFCGSSQDGPVEGRGRERNNDTCEGVRVLGEGLKAWRKSGYRSEGDAC